MTLTVPTPALAYDALAPGVAPRELPVSVGIGPVTSAGAPLDPVGLAAFGLLALRRLTAAGPNQMWSSAATSWVPDPGGAYADQSGEPLVFDPAAAPPWSAVLIGSAGKDAAGQPQYAKAVGGYPTYSFRAVFRAKDGQSGASAASEAVSFGSVSDKSLLVVGPPEGEEPDEATQLLFQLKNTARVVIGGLEVHRDEPGARVELRNAAGASVVLRADGSIEVLPAAGRTVVTGDLDAGRITYLPSGGGLRKSLG
jgi:hypothetical protein